MREPYAIREIKKYEGYVATHKALLDYLPKHVGESFTCAQLRKLYPGFDSHFAAANLCGYAYGVKMRCTPKGGVVKLDTPLVLTFHDGSSFTKTEYKVNLYTIEGLA